jgi:endonuclease/exonuclease/phosphatase family metal-dependent hydrolase
MEIHAITWNLFHGRDFPPNPALRTRRSKLLRTTERDSTHVQVNRNLAAQFAAVLCDSSWDVALLQECPPRWSASLAATCSAVTYRSLTSRNWLGPVRSLLARWNTDLLGSSEGGSNLTMVRESAAEGGLLDQRDLVLRRRPERRTMAFARLRSGVCIANLHASTIPRLAEPELRLAAQTALDWAGDQPLILGGDFNVRPSGSDVYEELAQRFGLTAPTAPDAIDHLLVRRLQIVDPPSAWAPEDRELPWQGLRLRLSDHAPVEARFRTGGPSA